MGRNSNKPEPKITIALIEPCIPQNTGNIARLTVATQARLLLVGNLGFSLSDKYLKRAGMDYWQYVDYSCITMDEFQAQYWSPTGISATGTATTGTATTGTATTGTATTGTATTGTAVSFLSTHATKPYTEIPHSNSHLLVFGNETHGLPSNWYDAIQSFDQGYRIPMASNCRSLNLSSSTAIITYHILGRNRFQGLA